MPQPREWLDVHLSNNQHSRHGPYQNALNPRHAHVLKQLCRDISWTPLSGSGLCVQILYAPLLANLQAPLMVFSWLSQSLQLVDQKLSFKKIISANCVPPELVET